MIEYVCEKTLFYVISIFRLFVNIMSINVSEISRNLVVMVICEKDAIVVKLSKIGF